MNRISETTQIILTDAERTEFEGLVRSTKTEHRLRQRARIVLLAAGATATRAIGRKVPSGKFAVRFGCGYGAVNLAAKLVCVTAGIACGRRRRKGGTGTAGHLAVEPPQSLGTDAESLQIFCKPGPNSPISNQSVSHRSANYRDGPPPQIETAAEVGPLNAEAHRTRAPNEECAIAGNDLAPSASSRNAACCKVLITATSKHWATILLWSALLILLAIGMLGAYIDLHLPE